MYRFHHPDTGPEQLRVVVVGPVDHLVHVVTGREDLAFGGEYDHCRVRRNRLEGLDEILDHVQAQSVPPFGT